MRSVHVSLERLKEMLDYDPATGVFRWKKRPSHNSRCRVGDIAGALKKVKNRPYRCIGIDGQSYHASQLAWFYSRGEWTHLRLSTKNGITTDVSADNLVEKPGVPKNFTVKYSDDPRAYLIAHRENNRAHYHDIQLRSLYGMTVKEYDAMLMDQNGVCAICELPERALSKGKPRKLSVDHCHRTRKIRGILCSHCNSMIGQSRDNPESLRKAADYLDLHQKESPP